MKILVIEDQDAIRRMVEALVRARGFEVITAVNGASGLEAALIHKPALILLDLMMPGSLDGFAVCIELRKSAECSKTPIVVVSALSDDVSRARASESGANAYFTKPFSPTALLREIEQLTANS